MALNYKDTKPHIFIPSPEIRHFVFKIKPSKMLKKDGVSDRQIDNICNYLKKRYNLNVRSIELNIGFNGDDILKNLKTLRISFTLK
jgi:hypothetical protein